MSTFQRRLISTMIVTVESHSILQITCPDSGNFLGYCISELDGKDLKALYGPRTDTQLLTSSILLSAGPEQPLVLIPKIFLYDNLGKDHCFEIKCSAIHKASVFSTECSLLMTEMSLDRRDEFDEDCSWTRFLSDEIVNESISGKEVYSDSGESNSFQSTEAPKCTMTLSNLSTAQEHRKQIETNSFTSSSVIQTTPAHDVQDMSRHLGTSKMPNIFLPPSASFSSRALTSVKLSGAAAVVAGSSILKPDRQLDFRTIMQLEADYSLASAAAVLGISQAELRSACRRLGIRRWNHRSSVAAAAAVAQADRKAVSYVFNLRRRLKGHAALDSGASACSGS